MVKAFTKVFHNPVTGKRLSHESTVKFAEATRLQIREITNEETLSSVVYQCHCFW